MYWFWAWIVPDKAKAEPVFFIFVIHHYLFFIGVNQYFAVGALVIVHNHDGYIFADRQLHLVVFWTLSVT